MRVGECMSWSMLGCEGEVSVFEDRRLNRVLADAAVFVNVRREFVKLLGVECCEEILSQRSSEIVEVVKKHLEENLRKRVLHWEISDLAEQYNRGFHILYTRQGLRRTILRYSAAVSAKLLKIYGTLWRDALVLYMLDEPRSHPVTKALFAPLRDVLNRAREKCF